MRFFFYGTLLDRDICRAVLGARADGLALSPAELPGFHLLCARRGALPVLARRSGGRVAGALSGNIDPAALLAIAHFEGMEYEPVRRMVIDGDGRRLQAWLFLANRRQPATPRPWTLARWQLRDKARLMPGLRSWFREYGAGTLQSTDIPWHVRRRIRLMLEE